MSGVTFKLASDEVSHDDASCAAVDDHEVHHLATRIHLHRPLLYLLAEGAVGAEEKLLTGLTARVERA